MLPFFVNISFSTKTSLQGKSLHIEYSFWYTYPNIPRFPPHVLPTITSNIYVIPPMNYESSSPIPITPPSLAPEAPIECVRDGDQKIKV